MEDSSGQKRNDVWYQCLIISLTVITFFVLAGTTFLSFYSGFPNDAFDLGLFEKEMIGDGSEDYVSSFAPAPFTFYIIWPIIFLFQWAWIMYVFTSFCRRNQLGPVFVNPPIITPFFLWVYNVGLAFSVAWIFIADREEYVWAFVVLFFSLVFLLMSTVSIHKSVADFGMDLQQNHRRDLIALRILLLNGVTMLTTWLTVANHLALGSVMSTVGDIDPETTSTILFGILATIAVVYFILENFVWDRYLRYTYTFWIVALWALIGIFAHNWAGLTRNGVINLILLVVVSVLGLTKLALGITRARATPLYVPAI